MAIKITDEQLDLISKMVRAHGRQADQVVTWVEVGGVMHGLDSKGNVRAFMGIKAFQSLLKEKCNGDA